MDSRLLSLPPELRTQIYRDVLLQSDPISLAISEPAHESNAQPGLLLTCHQIRNEAISIYYGENAIRLGIRSLRGNALVPLVRIMTKYSKNKDSSPEVRLVHYGRPSWVNLKDWLKQSHKLRYWNVLSIMADNGLKQTHLKGKVVGSAFKMVMTMKDQPWENVEKVLDLYHDTVRVIDGTWL